MPLIGFFICIALLVWRAIRLRSWLVHPEATLQRTISQWRSLHRIFFFVPWLVPYRYYERNPADTIRSYIRAEILAMALLVLGSVAAIWSVLAGK